MLLVLSCGMVNLLDCVLYLSFPSLSRGEPFRVSRVLSFWWKKALDTLRPRQPVPACASVRPRAAPSLFQRRTGGPRLFAQVRPVPAVSVFPRRQAASVRERAAFDATRCALAFRSGKHRPTCASIAQEEDFVNHGTMIFCNGTMTFCRYEIPWYHGIIVSDERGEAPPGPLRHPPGRPLAA